MGTNSGYDLESLMTPTLSATVFAAQETSLYLPGAIVPIEAVLAGSTSLQVPVLAKTTAEVDSAAAPLGADDFTAVAVTDTTVTIPTVTHVSYAILREAGGINPTTVGGSLGRAVAQQFDESVTALFTDFTDNTALLGSGADNALEINDIFRAASTLRALGIMGPLFAILHPEQIAALMFDINGGNFAAADAQNEAMRLGQIGVIGGVSVFQSAFVTKDTGPTDELFEGLVFADDAMRIAMQRNVNIVMEPRASAVGVDLVASLIAGVGIVDNGRGVQMKSTGFVVET